VSPKISTSEWAWSRSGQAGQRGPGRVEAPTQPPMIAA
jgi:hypothetical protein